MGTNWIVALTIAWLTCPVNGKVTCREVQLARDCEALCKRNRYGAISCELRVAVLLPADPSYDIALPKVLPVLGEYRRNGKFRGNNQGSARFHLVRRSGRLRSESAKFVTLLVETEIPFARRSLRCNVRSDWRDR